MGFVGLKWIWTVSCLVVLVSLPSRVAAETIAGTILDDHSGLPLAAAIVRLSSGGGKTAQETQTDSSGHFRITGLPAGRYILNISKGQYAATIVRLKSEPESGEDSFRPAIRLLRGGTISGQLIPSSTGRVAALWNASALVLPGSGKLFRIVTLDSTGSFRIAGLPPGRYVIGLLNSGSGPTLTRGLALYPSLLRPYEFAIYGGEEYQGVTLPLPPNERYDIEGKVAQAGAFSITVVSPHTSSLPVASTLSRPDGAFRITDLKPGTYDVLAAGPAAERRPNLVYGRTRIELGGNIRDLSIPVRRGPAVSVALRARNAEQRTGLCGEGGDVTFTSLDAWMPTANVTAAFMNDGTATVDDLALSRYRISVRSRNDACHGLLPQVVDLTGSSGPNRLIVDFGPRGIVRGRVIGAVASTGFAVFMIELSGSTDLPLQVTFTDRENQFEFIDVAPGRYYIGAQPATDLTVRWAPSGTGDPSSTFDVLDGQSKHLEITVAQRRP